MAWQRCEKCLKEVFLKRRELLCPDCGFQILQPSRHLSREEIVGICVGITTGTLTSISYYNTGKISTTGLVILFWPLACMLHAAGGAKLGRLYKGRKKQSQQ